MLDPTLCLVIGPGDVMGRDVVEVAAAAIAGGVTVLQLRWKRAQDATLADLACRLLPVCRAAGVPLIVNDRIEVARAIGADGVHLGQGDAAPALARQVLGPEAIIGWSVENAVQARFVSGVVDYVGLGPVLATSTKPDHAPPVGLEGFAALRRVIGCPVMAIGGVGLGNAMALRQAGADGLAVVSAICAAPDPMAATRALRNAFAT
jgi:thiamine-phosphate pyrophosphorylase